MAAAGILVLVLDFRQSQDAPYPCVDPGYQLGRALGQGQREVLQGYEGGGLGSSSGGHQILLTALRPRDERYTQLLLSDSSDLDARLSFVVACWPIAHPLECYRRARELNLDGVGAYEA